MRFLKHIVTAAFVLLFFSCTSVEEGLAPVSEQLTVSAEQNTRVQLSGEQKTVWTAGDLLSVFRYSDANSCWKFDGATGDAEGPLIKVSEGAATFDTDYTVLLYPHDARAVYYADSTLSTTFSGIQDYLAGSYGVGANMMVGAGSGNSFRMMNVCSFINFRMAGTKTVRRITLSGNNHDVLSGAVTVDVSTLAATLTDTDEDDSADIKKIVLDCGDGVKLSPTDTASFFVALMPHVFELGITMKVEYTDGTSMTKFTQESIVFERAKIYSITDVTGQGTIDENTITVEPYDGERATDAALDAAGSDQDFYWEANTFNNTVSVIYNGNAASVATTNSNINVTANGAHVTVDFLTKDVKNVEIILKGTATNGSLKVYGNKKYKLTLSGVDITSQRGPAINSQCHKRVFVHLAPGTTNRIADASSYLADYVYLNGGTSATEDRKGCFFAEGSLIFSGSGVLVAKGNCKHGIATDEYLTTRPGVTIAVTDAADNGIKAKGDSSEGIGIRVGGGLIYSHVSSTAGKALSTDGCFDMSGGKLELGTTGGGMYDATLRDATASCCLKVDSLFHISGGTIVARSTGDGGKGISVDRTAVFDGGTVDVATSGGMYKYSRSYTCSPKGIKVDGNLTINGGVITVNVTGNSEKSEGIESKADIVINGGEIRSTAYDDAVNAATGFTMNGGRLCCYASNNDGIDSNGPITINGGLALSSGSSTPEEAFDTDRSSDFHVNGGIMIGFSGGAIKPNTSDSRQNVVMYNNSGVAKDEVVSLCKSDGSTTLFSYVVPRSLGANGSVLIVSCPELANGSYVFKKGGRLSGYSDSWEGWRGPGHLSNGTELKQFTVSSRLTSIGSSSGGPGGWW